MIQPSDTQNKLLNTLKSNTRVKDFFEMHRNSIIIVSARVWYIYFIYTLSLYIYIIYKIRQNLSS